MSTRQFPDDEFPDGERLDSIGTAENQDAQSKSGSRRKTRQRSVYLFPAYGFTTALDIARRVEESGGGILTEETLAINLGLSAKSSGFRLKSLAARQFQLIGKQGDTLTTSPVAKAIFKPTSNEDALRGYRQSFLSIPLFQAVAERYRGQRLPDSQTLRNVLEREFHVDHSRVQQAERVLLDSARDTHLLKHTGDGTYLVVTEGAPGSFEDSNGVIAPSFDFLSSRNGGYSRTSESPVSPANILTFTIDEISQLEDYEFEDVWRAMGILVRSRKRRRSDPGVGDDLNYA